MGKKIVMVRKLPFSLLECASVASKIVRFSYRDLSVWRIAKALRLGPINALLMLMGVVTKRAFMGGTIRSLMVELS
ncbi:hypothetical protein IX91_25680 (plasmid) [Vibrio tubiashii ATCC 19109]|uniref:Uncharacterized protein n=1 Tax=Vibrio tubiashii ATCC 19109 TaxID=1051646 RepID=F9T598_9VIBR|nr:hypothetical protein IX91_25680 [Vibrio tubiashii ATCC 19109]EGU55295.1 hypothetical protein VITU9109_21154 [Vibrio tubiashii ATCC 19109]EIF04423.1 hypothetical protein VT1337_08651 [Vibrio tubiashii NCIMB 1337 = ATCC 19106]